MNLAYKNYWLRSYTAKQINKFLLMAASPAHKPLQAVFLCALPPLPAVAHTEAAGKRRAGRRLARENSNTPQLDYIMIFKVMLYTFQ